MNRKNTAATDGLTNLCVRVNLRTLACIEGTESLIRHGENIMIMISLWRVLFFCLLRLQKNF